MPPTPTHQRAEPPPRIRRSHAVAILALWLAIFFGALFSPPLLDDADATHAQAARAMVVTGDWVTLHVNGIRYLEKPPLPYWLVAISFRLFGFNTFAVHLPLALAVLALALLGYIWSRQAFGGRAALYTALATLTCTGVFLFTRIFIPEALLSLFLCTALYAFLQSLAPSGNLSSRPERSAVERPASWTYPYLLWISLALAVLTKGFVALVFFFGTALLYLALTGNWRQWRRLRPFTGLALFLLIAAPWHILASLRNTGGADGHGFFWFYFINEHVLRFLGRRIPRDYNKLPGYLYWSLHIVWLFPWSLFAPIGVVALWRKFRQQTSTIGRNSNLLPPLPVLLGFMLLAALSSMAGAGGTTAVIVDVAAFAIYLAAVHRKMESRPRSPFLELDFRKQSTLILALFSALVLLFFSLSTNQEYYTFPIYLPLLILIAAAIANAERLLSPGPWPLDPSLRRTLLFAHAAYTVIGLAASAALAYGLWSARGLAFVPDIGDLLAHRGVGDYTLSMSHFFDLTGESFAALRLPAALALAALAIGPATAWILRVRRRHFASTITVALTSALFLIAAHIALGRFAPMLSSQDFAEKIEELADDNLIERDNDVLLYGDQAYGSSIPFYLDETVELVDGQSTSMLFGSTFPDAPHIFLTPQDLVAGWGHGRRKILFIPEEKRAEVGRILGPNQILLEETSGKLLITDRPLNKSYR